MIRTLVWPDGTVYTIVRSSHDTAGAELEMEWLLPARGWAPQPHVHPSLTEEYEILEGSLDLLIGREWRQLRRGDHAAVPPGTVHTFRVGSDPRGFATCTDRRATSSPISKDSAGRRTSAASAIFAISARFFTSPCSSTSTRSTRERQGVC